jgi:hypothetical protein
VLKEASEMESALTVQKTHSERSIEYGIAGGIGEISHNDGFILDEARRPQPGGEQRWPLPYQYQCESQHGDDDDRQGDSRDAYDRKRPRPQASACLLHGLQPSMAVIPPSIDFGLIGVDA